MNIARKLLLMIVAATVSIAVLSITGLTGMSKIESRLAVLNDVAIPSIVLLEETSKEMFRMRVRVLSHLMTDEPEKLKSYEKEIQKFSGNVIEDLERYGRELVSDAEDKRLLEEDLKAIKAYFELRDKVLEQSRSHKKHDAQQLLIDKGAIPIAATEALTKHAKYNIDLAKQEGAAAKALYDKLFGFMLLLALLAIGIAAFVGYVIRRSVVNSLQDLRSTLRVIEQNHDFTQRAKVLARDEVGETVESVNRLVENLQASMREISEQTYEVAKAARLLNETAQVVTESASNQSAAAADMAATVEEMTVSINHVADQAAEASRLSSDSGSLAVNGESIIAKTVEDINEIAGTVHTASDYVDQLGRDSQKVNEIIGVIKDVADQTNLLALNAAIEAARAGEQGRGFAVVADEVRKLAERTTQSTQVIAETISAMQSNAQNTVNGMNEVDARVGHGVERAKSANEAIVQIRSSAGMAVDRVSEISNAIREQGIASTSIAQQVERIAQMSEENHAAAENTAATAQQLDTLAGTMQQVVSQYKI